MGCVLVRTPSPACILRRSGDNARTLAIATSLLHLHTSHTPFKRSRYFYSGPVVVEQGGSSSGELEVSAPAGNSTFEVRGVRSTQ